MEESKYGPKVRVTRGGVPKQVTVHVGDWSYNGRTETGALQGALAHLARFNSDTFDPIIVTTNPLPFIGVVHRNDHGSWAYGIQKDDGRGLHIRCGNWDDRFQAELKLRLHLAQLVFEPLDAERRKISSRIACVDPNLKRDHESWMDWQDRYATARLNGKTPDEARAFADGPNAPHNRVAS